jgi:hypothetical protein
MLPINMKALLFKVGTLGRYARELVAPEPILKPGVAAANSTDGRLLENVLP